MGRRGGGHPKICLDLGLSLLSLFLTKLMFARPYISLILFIYIFFFFFFFSSFFFLLSFSFFPFFSFFLFSMLGPWTPRFVADLRSSSCDCGMEELVYGPGCESAGMTHSETFAHFDRLLLLLLFFKLELSAWPLTLTL